MLESTDFACTLKETKTTIPISRTPKPISEFGLKPGKYRPSAVKVAGFDPLDANHAASTGGVASRPRQDVQTRKGKHWNERQPNDTAHANDRDGNGLRDREHAGRPGAGPIRDGGVGGYPSINTDAFGSVTIPKDAKEPKVTRPGFRFTGWSLKKTPDKDETLLTPGKDTVSMPAEGEVAVYAQWEPAMTTLPFTGGNAQIPTIWLWAGLAFLIIAAGAFSPMIRLRMGAGSKGRHAGTPTIGRHSR